MSPLDWAAFQRWNGRRGDSSTALTTTRLVTGLCVQHAMKRITAPLAAEIVFRKGRSTSEGFARTFLSRVGT
jgi:hypothetical protein